MKLTKEILFFSIITIITLTISCDADVKTYGDCEFDPISACETFTFSFVDSDTYENLMGIDGQPIHPDSLVITNSRKDTMHHEIYPFTDGWYTVSRFSVFQEITCFNQCLLDSSFTRTYYVYLGNGDTDTLEVFFPARSDFFNTFYNGGEGEYAKGYTTFWFLKKF